MVRRRLARFESICENNTSERADRLVAAHEAEKFRVILQSYLRRRATDANETGGGRLTNPRRRDQNARGYISRALFLLPIHSQADAKRISACGF